MYIITYVLLNILSHNIPLSAYSLPSGCVTSTNMNSLNVNPRWKHFNKKYNSLGFKVSIALYSYEKGSCAQLHISISFCSICRSYTSWFHMAMATIIKEDWSIGLFMNNGVHLNNGGHCLEIHFQKSYGETLLCFKLPQRFSWEFLISLFYGLFMFIRYSSLESSQNGGVVAT